MAAGKSVKVELDLEKETKNKVRYSEDADKEKAVIGKLYVSKKDAKKLGDPKKVTVTIEAG